MPPPSKPCRSCGRRITWRKKWERDWDEVLYCSAGCRSRGVSEADRALEERLRTLLRTAPKGVGDVDVARAVDADDWRAQLEPVRRAARRLVAAGEAEIVQGGRVVDGSTAAGPVTVRRRR
ncbi:DUF3253 domain-containing protein [Microlunatus capsulatus]|uniref:DUF2256 and DUF3253 domain-containing protein n=1 Tax=Microlunatus capsulatus TaxID=99117 RepID=A0ABS4ZCG2_9ACTN|nr:DUF2256 and DUF3253 domain-containing protein [Microlunatus capsulatus]MBP2418736.1 hypothetical protein [Microlunatus capsulatus]